MTDQGRGQGPDEEEPDPTDGRTDPTTAEDEPATPSRREGGREKYDTEPISFMVDSPDEVLAVKIVGAAAPGSRLSSHLAAKFLGSLNEFAKLLGGPLAIRQLRFGSAILDFVPDVSDQAFLSDEFTPPPQIVADALVELASASGSDEELLGHARELGHRAARAYVHLLEVLIEERVDTEWLSRSGKHAHLTRENATASHSALQREKETSVEERLVTGRLYLANANAKTFRLEPDGETRKIFGKYPASLEPRVAEMWSKRVRAKLRVTRHVLERSGEERLKFQLVDIGEAPDLFEGRSD